MIKQERLYRGQQPKDIVDVNSLIDDGGGDVVDVNSLIDNSPKKKEEAGGTSNFSATKFTLSLDQDPDDDVAKRILTNKRRAIGKTNADDPRKKLAGKLANDVFSVTKGAAAAASSNGMLSRANVNQTLQQEGQVAKDLRAMAVAEGNKAQIDAAQRATRIEQGDMEEIAAYTKEKATKLREQKAEIEAKRNADAVLNDPRIPIPRATGVQRSDDEIYLDDEEDDLLDTASAALRHSAVAEIDQKGNTPENRQAVGAKLRTMFNEIGIKTDGDYTVADEKAMIEFAKENETASGVGKSAFNVGAKLPEYEQEHQYKNEMEIVKSLAEVKATKLEKMQALPAVNDFLLGDEATRARLASHPDVADFVRTIQDMDALEKEVGANFERIAERYPQVKAAQDREQVIDAFAQYITKEKEQGFKGGLGSRLGAVGGSLWDFVAGDRIDTDEEIKAVVKLTGLPEDRVRELAKDYKLPSELKRGLEYFSNTFKSVDQFINRQMLSTPEADVVNRAIEGGKYKAPKSRELTMENLRNSNAYGLSDILLNTAYQGISDFAAYSIMTMGVGGIARGLGRGVGVGMDLLGTGTKAAAPGRAAAFVGENSLAGRTLARSGEMLNAATPQIAPKLHQLYRGTSAALKGVAPEGTALGNVVQKATRARDLAATFATGFASSYEDSYQEARQFTEDEDARENYAGSVAFLNGISELILPDIDIAKRLAAISGVKKMLREGTGKVALTRADVLRNFFGKLGETVGQEVLEEYIPMAGEMLLKAGMFDHQTTTSEFFNTLAETTINTVVASAGMGMGASNAQSSSMLTKQAMYEAGKTAQKSFAYIDKLKERGVLTPEQANERKQTVNTMADIISKLPSLDNKGSDLSEHKKVELAANQLVIRQEEARKAKVDKTYHPQHDSRIATAQANIQRILTGGKTRAEAKIEERTKATAPKPAAPATPAAATEPAPGPTTNIVENIGFTRFTPAQPDPNAPLPPKMREEQRKIDKELMDKKITLEEYAVKWKEIKEKYKSEQAATTPAATTAAVVAPLPRLQATNPIAQAVFDDYALTQQDELDDDEEFVMVMDDRDSATAGLLGAKVDRPTKSGARVTFTGRQLKDFINPTQDATQISQAQNQESGQQSSSNQYVRPNEGEQQVAQGQEAQQRTDDSNSPQRSRQEKKRSKVSRSGRPERNHQGPACVYLSGRTGDHR